MSKQNKDVYKNFKELKDKEVGNYSIEYVNSDKLIIIIAPHGGKIEFNTTEIAKLIAGNSFNYYSFIGQKNNNNRHLHITSHIFDEPKALELVGKSKIVVSIHGCKDKQEIKQGDIKIETNFGKHIFIGGLNEDLKNALEIALSKAGLSIGREKFRGKEKDNICNRGSTNKGVQFELTASFRNDGKCCGKFIEIVSRALLIKVMD